MGFPHLFVCKNPRLYQNHWESLHLSHWRTRASACGWGRSLTSAHRSSIWSVFSCSTTEKSTDTSSFRMEIWRISVGLGSAKLLVGHWKPGHWSISPNGSPWTPWKTDTRHSVTASQRHQSFQRLCTRESAMNLFSVQQGWFNGDLWRMYGGFLCHGVTLKSSKVRQTILVYVSIETHACGDSPL